MRTPSSPHFDIQITRSAAEVNPELWDALTGAAHFQSHRWYRFGEAVMADCQPTYLTLFTDGRPAARAALWLVRDEPLPVDSERLRSVVHAYLRRRPLMICRSPLSGLPGLALRDTEHGRTATVAALVTGAREQAHGASASFLVFDFLTPDLRSIAENGLAVTEVSGPGTVMELPPLSFDEFIARLGKDGRNHYRRTLRHAQELGIEVTRHRQVERIREALALIRNVERRFKSAPNPWMVGMMEHLVLADGIWLAATIGDRLVGCGLSFVDNGAQVVTALGLADDVPYVYFALGYEALRLAIDSGARTLYWGSGAYDVKQRLGFSVYPNNLVAFAGFGAVPRLIARVASAF
jgi:predicted N-acyltransferase